MNKEESLALYEKGKEAWNEWAGEMLAQRKLWADDGAWPEGEDPPDNIEAIIGWCDACNADFQECVLSDYMDFQNFVFPWSATFRFAQFQKSAMFDNVHFRYRVSFEGVNFHGDAYFTDSHFDNEVTFDKSCFHQHAGFRYVKFFSDARFDSVLFSQDTAFFETKFYQDAHFSDAQFHRSVGFYDARFMRNVWFDSTVFSGTVSFMDAVFKNEASFRAVKSEKSFSLAACEFHSIPDFTQMSFEEAPRLDNFQLLLLEKSIWQRVCSRFLKLKIILKETCKHVFERVRKPKRASRGDHCKHSAKKSPNNVAARFRALQRLAAKGHAHNLEQLFFREELKANQFVAVQPWHFRFWVTVTYELFSNFGDSTVRPLGWLVVSMLLFAGGYLAIGINTDTRYWDSVGSVIQQASGAVVTHVGYPDAIATPAGATCVPGNPGDPFVSALALSGRNSLPFAAGAFTETNRQAQACLYGVHKVVGRDQPKVPMEVVMLGAAQTIVSLILLFLFGLALRNHFKIK